MAQLTSLPSHLCREILASNSNYLFRKLATSIPAVIVKYQGSILKKNYSVLLYVCVYVY